MEVYSRPASRFVAGFVGSPAMNILKVALSGSGDRMQARLADGGLVPLPGMAAPAGASELGVRPEALTVTAEGGETEGTATVVERLGDRTLVHVRMRDGVAGHRPGPRHLDRRARPDGAPGFDTSALHLFGDDGRAWHSRALRAASPNHTCRHTDHSGSRRERTGVAIAATVSDFEISGRLSP